MLNDAFPQCLDRVVSYSFGNVYMFRFLNMVSNNVVKNCRFY